MKLYVTWTTYSCETHNVNGSDVNFIMKIEKDKPIGDIEFLDEYSLMGEFSKYGREEEINVTEVEASEDTKILHFLAINECGGGGSYHNFTRLYYFEFLENLYEFCDDWFDEEHNECENCKCKDEMIPSLEKDGFFSFEGSGSVEEISMNLYKISI